MTRKDKINYYLDIADTVLERSTCMRRRYGAIIVQKDEIIATGYNGAPRGRRNCMDLGFCLRDSLNIPSGERSELCRAVHAEANAIISASRRDMIDGTLYLTGRDGKTGELLTETTSCMMCRRLIINAGITNIVCRVGERAYTQTAIRDWVFNDDSLPETVSALLPNPPIGEQTRG
jgi:dCMP deaminase